MSRVTLDQLTDGEQDLLARAEDRLRTAVEEYVRVTNLATSRAGVERAQLDVEAAEEELWRSRSSLLNWSRPAWAPSATFVADWFSPEDRVCDEVESQ
jgi:hypothetical protein